MFHHNHFASWLPEQGLKELKFFVERNGTRLLFLLTTPHPVERDLVVHPTKLETYLLEIRTNDPYLEPNTICPTSLTPCDIVETAEDSEMEWTIFL